MALSDFQRGVAERRHSEDSKSLRDQREAETLKEKEAMRLKALAEQGRMEAQAEVDSGRYTPAEAFRRHAWQIHPTWVPPKEPDKFVQAPAVIDGRSVTVNSNTATGRITPINVPNEPKPPATFSQVTVTPPTGKPFLANSNNVSGRVDRITQPPQSVYDMMDEEATAATTTNSPPVRIPTSPAQPTQPASSGNMPAVGSVIRGYKFLGGNPADKNSWEKVQ